MRTVIRKHQAVNAPIADLITFRAIPTPSVEYIDPFLFLNHHGPQVYPAPNRGLPFGPHPHRGFETVTFILEGDILHKDSSGHESIIEAGGIQWMTAGSGLIHAEVSSPQFKQTGGPLEILQLWVNLPARFKLTKPRYLGLQAADIPTATPAPGVTVHAVAGEWADTAGAVQPLAAIALAWLDLAAGATVTLPIPATHNIFFYVVRGSLRANGTAVAERELAEFDYNGDEVAIEALTDSILLLGHAEPFGEPIVSAGPFVMNTEAEIRQAYADYQQGKFGTWNG